MVHTWNLNTRDMEDPWNFLSRQPSRISEFKVSEIPCLKNHSDEFWWMKPEVDLWLPHACLNTAPTYTHMHTHDKKRHKKEWRDRGSKKEENRKRNWASFSGQICQQPGGNIPLGFLLEETVPRRFQKEIITCEFFPGAMYPWELTQKLNFLNNPLSMMHSASAASLLISVFVLAPVLRCLPQLYLMPGEN